MDVAMAGSRKTPEFLSQKNHVAVRGYFEVEGEADVATSLNFFHHPSFGQYAPLPLSGPAPGGPMYCRLALSARLNYSSTTLARCSRSCTVHSLDSSP
jgi:hypothetical protein